VKLKAVRDGSVQVDFDLAEVELLREVPEQLRLLYEAPPDDVARARLFPRAYLDPTEERAEQQWQAAVHPELLRAKLGGLDAMLGAFDRGEAKGRRVRVVLGPDDVSVWLAVLNDARLAFGSRLGIDDDTDVYRIASDDPLALEKQAYGWLTLLQGELVEALLGTMPD
jgi:hypothetical protein